MKYAVALSKIVWSVECPECGFIHELTKAVDTDDTFECIDCNESFICGPGRD